MHRYTIPTNKVDVHPAIEPVTIGEVKDQSHVVDDDTQNGWIRDCIREAREIVELLACRSLITQTRIQYCDFMPCAPIYLRFGPVQSVTSIVYADTDTTTATLSATLYDVDINRIPARVMAGYGDSWPTAVYKTNAVAITYVAGFGATASSVPMIYRNAIKKICAYYFDNRSICALSDEFISKILDLLSIAGRTVEYA